MARSNIAHSQVIPRYKEKKSFHDKHNYFAHINLSELYLIDVCGVCGGEILVFHLQESEAKGLNISGAWWGGVSTSTHTQCLVRTEVE